MEKPRQNPVLIYDSECRLCNSAVKFLKSEKAPEGFSFVSSSDSAATPLLDRHRIKKSTTDKTVILIDGNRIFTKSAAIIKALQRKGHIWRLAGVFFIIPSFLRDFVYDWIAGRRK
ncbi:MAG TPA: DCC1-like thiol-disulfide oxidoreductase family protein [Bacteroidales bacterium]|nr:DCC1-like thiol-disulfide oxidoreductase family protein [Bacteroidales bacterium]